MIKRGLKANIYNIYIIINQQITMVKRKKQKTQKCVIKRKLKFKKQKNCLEATQFENKINYLQKSKTDSLFCYKKNPNNSEEIIN